MAEEAVEEVPVTFSGESGDDKRFVKILQKQPVLPSDAMLAGDPNAEPIQVHGQQGRVIGWDALASQYMIETFQGAVVSIDEANVEWCGAGKGENGGFDAAWPLDDQVQEFALEVTSALVKQGFCVVQCFNSSEARESAKDAALACEGWHLMPPELESAYLGRNPVGKIAWLETDNPDTPPVDGLQACDRAITQLSEILWPLTESTFNFATWGRTDGLVRVPCSDIEEQKELVEDRGSVGQTEIVTGRLEDHIKFIQQRILGIIYFVDGDGGSMTFHTKNGMDVRIPCVANRMVIFRHDAMSFTYAPSRDFVAVQAWIMAEPDNTKLRQFHGPPDKIDFAMGLELGPSVPVQGNTGKAVSLMGMDCMLAANGIGEACFWNFLIAGADGIRHLPASRWNYEPYFEEDKDYALGKYYSNHAGFVLENSLCSFDNEFFGISELETSQLDPCFRNTLEVGYTALHNCQYTRAKLKNRNVGVYVGNCGTDWAGFAQTSLGEKWIESVNAFACCTRLSYIFGLRGPTSTSDTACSSSLVAAGCAHNALRPLEPDQNIAAQKSDVEECVVIGTNALLSPWSFIALCGPKMLSQVGRCFTFDQSADGFARGEGTTAIVLQVTDNLPEKRYAMFTGSCINQDGRSASMTAPHGPSQQECIWASLREANVTPGDIRIAELHGTGTALGDPIEVGALRGVMKNRSGPIYKTSAKSNIAHGEANAGIAGLVKCSLMLLSACCAPNVHLLSYNPHLDINGYPVYISSEVSLLGTNAGYAGVSSFGFGGTNARADLWAKAIRGPAKTHAVDIDKLDYVFAKCPQCMGRMEHISAIAFGTRIPRPLYGRFKANSLRDEFDRYEVCSQCYTGSYQFGERMKDEPFLGGRYFIKGSWDGFSKMHEVPVMDESGGHFWVPLGHTRVESFRLCLEMNELYSYYPACRNAGMSARIDGPSKPPDNGYMWTIDGRDDEVAEGTVYHVHIFFDEQKGKSIRWYIETENPSLAVAHEHECYIVGTPTGQQLVRMKAVEGKDSTYEYVFSLAQSGRDEFQFVRDGDYRQIIYPAYHGAVSRYVPVRGPDDLGKGKMFFAVGMSADRIVLQISILDGHISISCQGSRGKTTWDSVDGRRRHSYFLSVLGASSRKMEALTESPDVFTARLEMQREVEEFQIECDEDPSRAIYPEITGVRFPGKICSCGPDAAGANKYFCIEGEPGSIWDVFLDLKHEDSRKRVMWKLLQDDGTYWDDAQFLK